eukprot:CAMPEP_0194365724 /NCGR_PEP_ID=MMETSP0174-20130528/13762_1 /TAXON_ID=216777 /ORGANISM="Proboscia alata, Strain PI-D3" /LENGTH=255 /DNA_ID=CAMNT_0039140551 /DNA_START=563 /DNA_END=1327 /DNA_ORIENTATION=-
MRKVPVMRLYLIVLAALLIPRCIAQPIRLEGTASKSCDDDSQTTAVIAIDKDFDTWSFTCNDPNEIDWWKVEFDTNKRIDRIVIAKYGFGSGLSNSIVQNLDTNGVVTYEKILGDMTNIKVIKFDSLNSVGSTVLITDDENIPLREEEVYGGNQKPSPSDDPSADPSSGPSALPSLSPSSTPSVIPSASPSSQSSSIPSRSPSSNPSRDPSADPSLSPRALPSLSPSSTPSGIPSASPSSQSLSTPSRSPSSNPF